MPSAHQLAFTKRWVIPISSLVGSSDRFQSSRGPWANPASPYAIQSQRKDTIAIRKEGCAGIRHPMTKRRSHIQLEFARSLRLFDSQYNPITRFTHTSPANFNAKYNPPSATLPSKGNSNESTRERRSEIVESSSWSSSSSPPPPPRVYVDGSSGSRIDGAASLSPV